MLVRRAAGRYASRAAGVESFHLFSFGGHYDAANTHFGLLVAVSDHLVPPGAGFPAHLHANLEIVTWVLSGSLVHEDSTGRGGLIYPGLVQRLTAGRGISHAEMNAAPATGNDPSDRGRVRFVQMWVVPDEPGAVPGYEQRDVAAQLRGGTLVPVASGRPGQDAAVRIKQRSATLHVARLHSGQAVVLPAAPYVHVYVAVGSVDLEGAGPLESGDEVRITAGHGKRGRAGPAGAEVLVWEMHDTLPRP